MGDSIIYLEKFVESTAYLPPELQRILNTIKDLDERSEDLAAQIQENVELVLQKSPSTSSRKSGPDEVAELRARIDADQRLLIQFSEEKVQLAVQGYDLLEAHYNQLNADIADFTQELQAKGLDPLGDSFMGVEDSGTKGGRGAAARFDSFDSLEPSQLEVKPPRKVVTEKATTPAPMAVPSIQQQAQADGYATGRRRAAQAAVHAAAAAVAAMEQDEEFQEGGDAAAAAREAAAVAAPPPVSIPVMPAAPPPVPAAAPVPMGAAPVAVEPFPVVLPQPPHGLKHAAENPQVAGRLLTYQDISSSLVGKRGELFWPDDNLWYLVEIHTVDLENRKAHIMYMTGEAEELDLDEIVKEGHLTLHTV